MNSRMEVLLSGWGRWAAKGGAKSVGYPRVSPMFRDARSGNYESSLPSGLGSADFECVDKAVNGLPEFLRAVLIHRYVMGRSDREIACFVGCTHVCVGRFIRRAFEFLENIMFEDLTVA